MAITASETRDWAIYKITSPSGRVYVGITLNEKTRKYNYKYANCKEQPLIYHSIKKYGWDNHKHEIIERFTSDGGYAYGKEMVWIRSYMCNFSKYPEMKGLNLSSGGAGNFGHRMSEQSKKKCSISKLGIKKSDEMKRRLSESRKGIKLPPFTEERKAKARERQLGKKLTEEQKDKIRQTRRLRNIPSPNKGKKMSEQQKRFLYKPVLVYNLNGMLIKEFISVKDAAKELSVSKNTITGCAKGIIKNPIKYIFKYK